MILNFVCIYFSFLGLSFYGCSHVRNSAFIFVGKNISKIMLKICSVQMPLHRLHKYESCTLHSPGFWLLSLFIDLPFLQDKLKFHSYCNPFKTSFHQLWAGVNDRMTTHCCAILRITLPRDELQHHLSWLQGFFSGCLGSLWILLLLPCVYGNNSGKR